MFCRRCGSELPDDAVFCRKCGERLMASDDMKRCKRCGALLTEENPEFCFECGFEQGSNADENQADAEISSSGKRSKASPGTIVFGIAAVIVVLFIVLNIHVCDWCHKAYFGPGYDIVYSDDVVCDDCALKYYGPYRDGAQRGWFQ